MWMKTFSFGICRIVAKVVDFSTARYAAFDSRLGVESKGGFRGNSIELAEINLDANAFCLMRYRT